MKVLIAPDKFKDSLSSLEVCESIKRGLLAYDKCINIVSHPLADGGDGSLEVIKKYIDCESVFAEVENPLGNLIEVCYLLSKSKKAYIELASASGLGLLEPKERSPLNTSSFGTGQLVLHAINLGAKEINLFIGGSATNDAGIGIASALGVEFIDATGNKIKPIGKNLPIISDIRIENILFDVSSISFNIYTDVKNVLYGNRGAAYVFAKQKGAMEHEIDFLDIGLKHFAEIIYRKFDFDISSIKGGGAAGGVGAGLYALFNVNIKSGIDEIFKLTNFEKKFKNLDLVITGEGKLDESSFNGKVVGEVTRLAKTLGKKVVILVGENTMLKESILDNILAIDSIIENAENVTDAFLNASYYLEEMAIKTATQNTLPW